MLEKLTKKTLITKQSIKVITIAQEESQRLGHNFIGTEQILLALIKERTGIAAKVLQFFGVKLANVKAEVRKTNGQKSTNMAGEILFTPRSNRILELALEESRQLKHYYVGTEHILLGIIRIEDSLAARVLENLGINLAGLRDRIIVEISRQKSINKKLARYNSSQLLIKIARFLAIFENSRLESIELSDRIDRELYKRAILNNDIAEGLNKLSQSSLGKKSQIEEFLRELQIAIEADLKLSSEEKESALEMLLIIVDSLEDLRDDRQRKLAVNAFKVLQAIMNKNLGTLSVN